MKSVAPPPRDSSCLTSVVASSCRFPHSPPQTHTLFSHCLPLSSVPAYNGHTPIRRFSIGNVFRERQSSPPCRSVVLAMDYGCLLFCFSWVFFLYFKNTTLIAPLGLILTGFITLTLPRFNSLQTGRSSRLHLKIAHLPFFPTNLSSKFSMVVSHP